MAWTPFRLFADSWRGARITRRRPMVVKLDVAI
jgi:hypothetical protein